MPGQQRVAKGRFVVQAGSKLASRVEKNLAAFGDVEQVLDDGVIVLRIAKSLEDPKSTWERLRAAVGPSGWAAPVMTDASGQPHYPTGEVTVRFAHHVSDSGLTAFAGAHRLGVRSRNKFVRQQVTFDPVDRNVTYLPELVEQLAHAEGVRAAWANTRSSYRRVEQRG